METPSVDLVDGTIIACYMTKCWLLVQSAWEEGPSTLQQRRLHTSAVLPSGGLLLLGGQYSPATTEIVRPNQQSLVGFTLSPGRMQHCSVLTGDSTILITGGDETNARMVQKYSGIDQGDSVSAKDLPSLKIGRRQHACGIYYVGATKVSSLPPPSTQDATQVVIVAGGTASEKLDSTETLDLTNEGAQWVLRAGRLPSPLDALSGATLNNVFYVTGGGGSSTSATGYFDTVLSWTEANEDHDWTKAGNMVTERFYHAVAAVPNTTMAEWCG
jgi:hypothetical protein